MSYQPTYPNYGGATPYYNNPMPSPYQNNIPFPSPYQTNIPMPQYNPIPNQTPQQPQFIPVQLAIHLDGETLPETTMYEEITTAGVGQNVAAATLIRTGCGCCGRVSIVNTGTTTVEVLPNVSFFVKRVA